MRRFWTWLAITAACGAATVSSAAAAEPTPQEMLPALFSPENIAEPTLSPDGRRLAFVSRHGSVVSLVVQDLASPYRRDILRAEADESTGVFSRRVAFTVRFGFLAWADNDTLVYAVALPPTSRGRRDEVHRVRADGREDRKLFDSAMAEQFYTLPEAEPRQNPDGSEELPDPPPTIPVARPVRVLGFDPGRGGSLLIEAQGNALVDTTVIRVDVTSGATEELADQDGTCRMMYDAHGRACVRETPRSTPIIPSMGRRRMLLGQNAPVFRQRFQFRRPDHGEWRNLDDLGGRGSARGFAHDDEDYYRPRSLPLAVDRDGSVLYYASNVGRNTFGIYGLDLRTGTRTDLAVESDTSDVVGPEAGFENAALVFDRQRNLAGIRLRGGGGTRWIDPMLARVQDAAQRRFPGRVVEILSWSEAKSRALLLVGGPPAPERYFIFDRGETPTAVELARRFPRLPSERVARTEDFEFVSPAGVRLTGRVTVPWRSRVNPPPLVVICPDVPGVVRMSAGFEPQVQALAAFGFMVVRVNYRGVAGFGLAHRDAIKSGVDRVPLEDVRAALRWLTERHPFDHRRVALLGSNFGGYVALRAVELFPTEFRCAVAINAPADLAAWASGRMYGMSAFSNVVPEPLAHRRAFFATDAAAERDLDAVSVLRHVDQLQRPVLIINPRELTSEAPSQGAVLREALRKLGRSPEYMVAATDANDAAAGGSAKVYERIGGFLNSTLFEYAVRVGPEHEVESAGSETR